MLEVCHFFKINSAGCHSLKTALSLWRNWNLKRAGVVLEVHGPLKLPEEVSRMNLLIWMWNVPYRFMFQIFGPQLMVLLKRWLKSIVTERGPLDWDLRLSPSSCSLHILSLNAVRLLVLLLPPCLLCLLPCLSVMMDWILLGLQAKMSPFSFKLLLSGNSVIAMRK